MVPEILVTPARPMILMSIGDDAPKPSKWNRRILVISWTAQALILFLRQILFFMLFMVLTFMAHNTNLWAWLALLVIMTSNFAFLVVIFLEIHQFRKGKLSVEKFNRFQVAKVSWLGCVTVLELLGGHHSIFEVKENLITLLKFSITLAPFIWALFYARRLRKQEYRDEAGSTGFALV